MGEWMGSRHRCETCGAEVIVTVEGSEGFAVTCCGAPLTVIFTKADGAVDGAGAS
jgi:hypothetical protein